MLTFKSFADFEKYLLVLVDQRKQIPYFRFVKTINGVDCIDTSSFVIYSINERVDECKLQSLMSGIRESMDDAIFKSIADRLKLNDEDIDRCFYEFCDGYLDSINEQNIMRFVRHNVEKFPHLMYGPAFINDYIRQIKTRHIILFNKTIAECNDLIRADKIMEVVNKWDYNTLRIISVKDSTYIVANNVYSGVDVLLEFGSGRNNYICTNKLALLEFDMTVTKSSKLEPLISAIKNLENGVNDIRLEISPYKSYHIHIMVSEDRIIDVKVGNAAMANLVYGALLRHSNLEVCILVEDIAGYYSSLHDISNVMETLNSSNEDDYFNTLLRL